MDWYKTVILILIFFGLSFCSHFPLRKYYYISSPKTWKDAQVYCREKYTDLATFESVEDVNQLTRPENIVFRVWTGLHDDPASWRGTLGNDSNSWRWSTTGQPITSQYHNWDINEPDRKNGKEKCVTMDGNGSWKDIGCGLLRPSLCYTDVGQNQKAYEFISANATWSDAQTYCRQHYTDLAVITNSEENTRVQSVIPAASTESWIGLYRVPWRWSDESPSTFRRWNTGQPDAKDNYCVVELDNHKWGDYICGYPYPFICHEVRKSKTTMKIKMKTTADLTDPAVNEQILQKINAALKSQGWTDVKLGWTTPPSKAQEKTPLNSTLSISFLCD